ncbi:CoA pyrophosphatase [Chthonobacter albigriseus]|uniref:CoA pyrophosphatase n=1 Tax=Chthonobacter albigriseus TaxID=1683161 RepID=UPI0015EF116D|nr:CoA pyrophosphatase [Chthonobacter albigriseus]
MSDVATPVFSTADLDARRERLHPLDTTRLVPRLHAGDHVTDPSLTEFLKDMTLRDAAVLIGIVGGAEGASMILTLRTAHLKAHAGQIALPGGKIDPEDADPVAAALREAEEEIGLDRRLVRPLGLLDPYISNTGYRIFPVVAVVEEDAPLTPNPEEVADVFQVPLAFLMTPENHLLETRPFRGVERRYYAMPYQERRIWGVTAGILRLFYEQVYR